MRNFRKVIALVLAVALMMSTFTVAFAAEDTSGSKLVALGLLADDTASSLSKGLTREIGLTMILKTLGYVQADANKAVTAPFTDTKGWVVAWANLAFEKGITKGKTATTFGGKLPMTGNEFLTLALRGLGVTVTDTTKALDLAIAAGFLPAGATLPASFTKAAASDIMFAALAFADPVSKVKLIDKLIAAKLVTREAAVTVGLVAGDVAVTSATITGVKTVTVVLNQAVDTTKAVLKIKKGAAIYGATVVWDTAKTTATLTTVVNLPSADYVVEVSGLTTVAVTKAFTVKDVATTKLEIVSTTVDLKNGATIAFKVSNQYGEDMKINGTTSGFVVSAYNTTQKRVESITNITADSKLTFPTLLTNVAKLADVIRVTVAYAGFTAQANVTVAEVATAATIAFADVAPLKDKTKITISETGLVVPYTMMDQFGVAKKFAAYAANLDGVAGVETIEGVQFISSAPTTVSVDSFASDADGKLTFAAGAVAGTATITAIINASGAVATFKVVVTATGIVDSLVIAAPAALVAATETVKLELTAADQFGVTIAAKDIAGVVFTVADATVVTTASIVDAKLVVVTGVAGTTVITAKVGTKVVGTVTIVVEAKAAATEVKSIAFGPKFELGAMKTLTTSDFVVIDQYGRTIDKAGVTFTVVEKTAADTQFTTSGAAVTAAVVGSSVFTLTATANATTAANYEFTLSVIASADITSFAITAVPTMYSLAPHAKVLELVGKTAAGDTVVLKDNKITQATSANAALVTATTSGGVVTVTGVAITLEGTAVVAVWSGSTKLAETTITLSKVAPVVTTVAFKDPAASVAIGTPVTITLEVKDQYGVAIADTGFWTSSDAAKATVVGGLVTRLTAGDVTIGYVTTNGLVVTAVLK